jgi:hypothetical protein
MWTFGQRSYPLCLVDTNALSEMAKDESGALMRHFLEWATDGPTMIPCFSPFTLLELRRSPTVLKQVVERFAQLPAAMVKGYVDLLEEERSAYPDPSGVEVLSLAFVPPPLGEEGNRLQNVPWMLDQHAQVLQGWSDAAPSILSGIQSLVPNYRAAGSSYTTAEIDLFVFQVVTTQLFLQESTAEWAKATVNGGQAVEIDAFPSLKAMAYTVFYKFYADADRKASASDVIDMLIAATLPYVEVFITENHQAEALKKARHQGFLPDLEVFRLRDLRSGLPRRG